MSYYGDLTLQQQLESVTNDAFNIQHIPDPCLEVQLRAVNAKWQSLQYIKNPFLEVQLSAVRKEGLAIQFISNPSAEVQVEAVLNDNQASAYINNFCYEAQLALFNRFHDEPHVLLDITDVNVLKEAERMRVEGLSDVDWLIRNEDNQTFLFFADNSEIVIFLLNQGVDPHVKDKYTHLTATQGSSLEYVIKKWLSAKRILRFLRNCYWYRLDKLVRSKVFCEWYYAPENIGGIRIKNRILEMVS
jgi:hypothetical protein